uniref:Uncharacterized protein n=1 Tax=Rhizophagus irregularis (strain DAOM 181602 / DAOM 197198 / MUCL 43194) TaxID=747089 RepID=U9UGC9_RHIID
MLNLLEFKYEQQNPKNFCNYGYIEDFKKLQFINFSKLQNLKIPYQCPKPDYMKKFLEINGSVSPEDLESFIINWKNRTSKKLLCIIIIESYGGRSSLLNEENMLIIKKYENLGIIKFGVKHYEEEHEIRTTYTPYNVIYDRHTFTTITQYYVTGYKTTPHFKNCTEAGSFREIK